MSARAGTGWARRWPGLARLPCGGRGAAARQSPGYPLRRPRQCAAAVAAEGTGLARQLNDPATSAFAAFVAGNVCWYPGDLPQAIAHFEDGLAALPTAVVHARLRVILLLILAAAAG